MSKPTTGGRYVRDPETGILTKANDPAETSATADTDHTVAMPAPKEPRPAKKGN